MNTTATRGTKVRSLCLSICALGISVAANAGEHGFLRSPDGAIATFDVPGGSLFTNPIAINLQGAVVGYCANENGVIGAFLRRADGTFETWSGPGAQKTGACNINMFGAVVGHYFDNSSVTHGLVRSPGGKLTTFDVQGAGTAAGQGTECPGCSVGFNLFGASAGLYIDGNNVVRGFLRSPVGELTGLGCYNDCSVGLNESGAITSSYLDANNVYHGFVLLPR